VVHIDATDETIDKRVKQHCAPLFATDRFLKTGHDESTTNATVTFVKFESRLYAVTCHHVLAAFFASACAHRLTLVPSIHTNRAIQQFASFRSSGEFGWTFRSCREFAKHTDIADPDKQIALDRKNANKPDIAIADVTQAWPSFVAQRGANAIDLDQWMEPDWATVQRVWMAYGFPNDHKYRIGKQIAAPMSRVKAELVSAPSIDRPQFTLCSTLDSDHGWGFSGLSGGPVVVAHSIEDRYAFVGITFEGAPSTKELPQNTEAFVGKKDIVLMGYTLTPQHFAEWLMKRQHEVALP
jgi:hypothetical protein